MKETLFIRADASPNIGTGHVMRMVALSQAWKRHGGDTVFICAQIPDTLAKRVRDEGFEVVTLPEVTGLAEDASATLAVIATRTPLTSALCPLPSAPWLIADGYHFGPAFQREVRASGARLGIMDDNGENGCYDCDLIVNQNVMAREAMYARRNADARLLLGTQYCLLRREFRSAPGETRQPAPRAEKILITFGGADTAGLIEAVVGALHDIRPRLHIRCVLGSLAATDDRLEILLAGSPHRLEVLRNVHDMTGVMRWADLSINAAGSTTWELCAMRVPMILAVLADNQREIAETLAVRGCAVNAGDVVASQSVAKIRELFDALAADSGQRASLAQHAHALVDGRGAMRVAEALAANGSRT